MMALHNLSYLMPTRVVVNNKSIYPAVAESKRAFFQIVGKEQSMVSSMNTRNAVCREKGIKEHPVIFEYENRNEMQYSVCVSDTIYDCSSFIDAVDVAFKVYVIFEIPFPPECEKIWLFLNEIFYKCDLPQKPSAKLISILNNYQL